MHDVVAVIVVDAKQGERAFLTWRQLYDEDADGAKLVEAIRKALSRGLQFQEISSVRICHSLQEATRFEYFFEGLLDFAHERILYGSDAERQRKKRRKNLENGRGLWLLGPLRSERSFESERDLPNDDIDDYRDRKRRYGTVDGMPPWNT